MSTSQTDSVDQLDGVPMALLDGEERVLAVISWFNHDDEIKEFIFTHDKAVLELLPRIGDGVNFDEWAVELSRAGKLVDYYDEVVRTHRALLSIDDCRPGNSYSYLVYPGDRVTEGPWMEPAHVYQLEVDAEPGEATNPRLETADEVLALAELPEAVHVHEVPQELAGATWDDPEVVEELGDLSGSLRINYEWEIGKSQELFVA